MTLVRPWLIAVALSSLGACSAAPPPAPPLHVAPPASARWPAPPPSPGSPLGLGPLRPLSPEDALAPSSRPSIGDERRRVFFGHGTLVSIFVPGWSRAPNSCPILGTADLCSVYTLTVTDQSPDDEGWPTGEAPSKAVTRTISLPAPARWTSFSGGRDLVYAFAGYPYSSGQLDQIDERGEVRPFVESESLGQLTRVAVVELGERRIVVGSREASPLQVAEVVAGKPGKARTLGPPTTLGMVPVPGDRKTVGGARDVGQGRRRPMVGPLVAIPTRDDKGASTWALVWVEAILPPLTPQATKGHPRGKAPRHDAAESVLLAARSVEKRVHITRFKELKQVSDRVVLSTHDLDGETSPFLVRPTEKGIEINGVTHDRNGKSVETRTVTTPATSPEPMTPDEELITSGFDEASNEGAVVYWSGDRARWRRFDGQGNLTGTSVALTGDPTKGFALYASLPQLSSSAGGWWLSDLVGSRMLSLDRDALVPGPSRTMIGLFPGEPRPMALEVWGDAMSTRRFDPMTGALAEASEALTTRWGGFSSAVAVSGAGLDPSLLDVRGTGPGSPVVVCYTPSSDRRREIPGSIPGEIGGYRGFTVHRVWGDVVVVAEGYEGLAATWIKAGQTVVYPLQEDDGQERDWLRDEQPRGNIYGPLVLNGKSMLPSKPGPLIETPELEWLGGRCQQTLPTAPGTLAMICPEAVHKDKPGIRLGLQTYRFRE